MPDVLEHRLAALAEAEARASLDGLEDGVWAKVQARRAASASASVRAILTIAALAFGLAFGALHHARPAHLAELGVLSDDGLLAPSVRLGGGA